MAAIRIYRRLQDQRDVDPNGLPHLGLPRYHTDVSSFVVETVAGGGASFSLGLSTLGNTAGDTGVTGTRVVLAGAGNITLSQVTDANGGTITISGSGGGAGFSAGISGGNAAGDTGVTGTRLALAGGNNITLSGATDANGGTVTVVGPNTVAQTVQTQNLFDLTLAGNTAGVLALVSSGTLTLAGGNSITLSQNGNAITISGATTSQSVQTQNMVDVTLSGNTAGVLALVSSGTLTLAGGNNITVSQNGNAVTISGPNVAGAQTGISGIANSQTTFTSGTVSLSELGAITIRSTTGNQFQFSVNAQTGTQFSAGISGGNTAGDTGTVAGRVVLAGGANITLSGSTNGASETISIVGGAGGAFSAGISGGNTSGDTGVTGTRLVFAGGNSITLSGATDANGGTITVSAPNASVLSAVAPLSTSTNGSTISILAPAQLSVGFSTQGNTSGDTGFVTGRLALVGSNGITLSGSTNAGSQTITISGITQSVESQSIGMSNIGNTSGTTGVASGGQVRFVFAGGNNITLSQSLNGASGTITISGANTAAQTNQTLGMYAVQNTTGQSSSTTMDARTISVAGDGAASVGYSAGSLRISVPVQTVESQSIGMSNVGNTSGTTGMASGGQVRFVIAGGNNITLSQSLNGASGTLTISAFNQTGTQFSAGISGGNTAGDTGTVAGRVVLAGGANITLSGSTNGASETISIVGGAGGGGFSAGASNLGNTAGSTGVTGTRLVLVGTNNISLSQSTDANGGTVSFNNTVSAFQAGVSTGGNTAGDTGVTGTRLVLVGSSPMSLSQATGANGGTVTINAPATSSLVGTSGISISTSGSTISIMQTSGYPVASAFEPYGSAPWTFAQQGQGTLHVQPLHTPRDIQLDRVNLGFVISNASNSSGSITLTASVGVYTQTGSTMSLLSSVTRSTNFSGSGTVGSYSLYGGQRWLTIPWNNTLSLGDYFLAVGTQTASGGAAGHSISQIVMTQVTHATFSGWSGILGAATNASAQNALGLGVYSASTGGLPNSIGFSELVGTGLLALASPIYQMRLGSA